ncbi:MFS transporter [Rhodococcus opacus]|uniref:MFS transporter n=1 Tax=Rhodococcus opacus TaxID=37919 RepID=UPI00211DD572|nr:MFS transporter [Rhodococcus opacus]
MRGGPQRRGCSDREAHGTQLSSVAARCVQSRNARRRGPRGGRRTARCSGAGASRGAGRRGPRDERERRGAATSGYRTRGRAHAPSIRHVRRSDHLAGHPDRSPRPDRAGHGVRGRQRQRLAAAGNRRRVRRQVGHRRRVLRRVRGRDTSGRLLGGRVVDRYGRSATVRWSAALAVAGVLIVILAGNLVLAALGCALWGVGVALGFPLALSAAADSGADAARRVSAVSTLGYVAFLVGPPLLGLLGEQFGLLQAFCVVLAGAVLAGLVASAAGETRETEDSPPAEERIGSR